jgi:YHS domain-containing protein
MKDLTFAACITLSTLAIGCTNAPKVSTEKTADSAAAMPIEVKYSASIVNNKKDPSCGMPVTAGISDTMHYNGKVIGFCSAECKADFAKDATKKITGVEWK